MPNAPASTRCNKGRWPPSWQTQGSLQHLIIHHRNRLLGTIRSEPVRHLARRLLMSKRKMRMLVVEVVKAGVHLAD